MSSTLRVLFALFLGAVVFVSVTGFMGGSRSYVAGAASSLLAWKGQINHPTTYGIASTILFLGLTFSLMLVKKAAPSYGDARWAKLSDLEGFGLTKKQGLLFGHAFKTSFIKALFGTKYKATLRMDEPLSTLILAPPGTGKTAGVCVPNLLTCENSMLIYDVKPELFDMTSKARQNMGHKVLRFDPTRSDTSQWNPLAESELPDDWNEIVIYVKRIASILYVPPKGGGDSFFVDAAKSVFNFFALYLIWKNGETTFSDIIEESLNTADVQLHIAALLEAGRSASSEGEPKPEDNSELDALREMAGDDPELLALLESTQTEEDEPEEPKKTDQIESKFGDMPLIISMEGNALVAKAEKEFGSVFSTYKNAMDVFTDPRVKHALSGSDFNAFSFRHTPLSVYFTVKANDAAMYAPISRMMFEITMGQLMSVMPDKKKDRKVTLMLDEFIRLGKLEAILKAPALSRGYMVNTVFIAQDRGQIKELYGEDGLSEIDSTAAYSMVLQQNNLNTSKFYSEKIGKTTRDKKSVSGKKNEILQSDNVSTSAEGHPLVMPEEIGQLPFGDAILLGQGFNSTPVAVNLPFFFEDPKLKKLLGSIEEQ